jgi:hypothetical protein
MPSDRFPGPGAMKEKGYEGETISEKDLSKMQDHQAQGSLAGHMRKPEAQATPGLNTLEA